LVRALQEDKEVSLAIGECIRAKVFQLHQHFISSFSAPRSLKRKKTLKLDCIFALLGSASVKDVHKTLVKSTPGRRPRVHHEDSIGPDVPKNRHGTG